MKRCPPPFIFLLISDVPAAISAATLAATPVAAPAAAQGNALTGPLSSALVVAWGGSLQHLDLSSNQLQGRLPGTLGPACPRLR